MTRKRAMGMVLAVGLAWGALDQATKYLAVADLTTLFPEEAGLGERLALFYGTDHPRRRPPVPVLPPVWEHVYVQNPAGAFGFLGGVSETGRRAFFLVVALVAVGGLLWMGWRTTGPGWGHVVRLALGLVLGGALGNLVDRAVHGYVIDFIHWHWRDLSWPPFNLADTGIVVGVFALLLFMGRAQEAEASARRPPEGGRAS